MGVLIDKFHHNYYYYVEYIVIDLLIFLGLLVSMATLQLVCLRVLLEWVGFKWRRRRGGER